MSGLARLHAVALVGLEPHRVRIECARTTGLPGLRLVGLPDAAVREAADRVRTAIEHRGFTWPQERLVINLAPADLPKVGSSFDLPLALVVLAASGQLPAAALGGLWAAGELGLDGSLRSVAGLLPAASGAQRFGARRLMVPACAAAEAALVPGLSVLPAHDLRDAAQLLVGARAPRPVEARPPVSAPDGPDLAEVRGQLLARRAVELAAAGGHHLLLSGPPGCGKTMLAQRLHGLLPPLPPAAALEVAAIHSLAGERDPDRPLSLVPPLREPHHGASLAALIGGGSGVPRPGELSLAHHGLLLLDELLETPRHVLDALRQPLERGFVVLSRARARVTYPARVQLVAATNPCPCGHLGSPVRGCNCRPDRVERYRARLSGPLLDRLDLHVEVPPVDRAQLLGPADGEPTAVVARRVQRARAAAAGRWGPGALVARADPAQVRATARPAAVRCLVAALDRLSGSARGVDRALRVARTIADLDACDHIEVAHVEEALAYRLPMVGASP